MKILSHRGYWRELAEKNTTPAFTRSCELGFGTETDIRDCAGRLVISHDIPVGNEIDLDEFLCIYQKKNLPLALNIKSDGLVNPLKYALQAAGVTDWFVFDMSIPDLRSYLDAQVPVFARVSEVEREPVWVEEVAGIWFDSFSGLGYDTVRIAEFLDQGLRVCIVSPELHGRPHEKVWTVLAALSGQTEFMLCTDYPEQASAFFLGTK
jgi:glycerophosphoryl diester phosphodiesterase